MRYKITQNSNNKEYLVITHKYFKHRFFVLEPMAELNDKYYPENEINNIKYHLDHSTDEYHAKLSIENW